MIAHKFQIKGDIVTVALFDSDNDKLKNSKYCISKMITDITKFYLESPIYNSHFSKKMIYDDILASFTDFINNNVRENSTITFDIDLENKKLIVEQPAGWFNDSKIIIFDLDAYLLKTTSIDIFDLK